MWFKNLKIYRFSKPFKWSTEQLEQQLSDKSFQPCAATQPSSYGWASPLKHPEADQTQLTHSIGQYTMICSRQEERILPASVVNDALNDKLDSIQSETGRRPVGKYKQSIKDELILDLLPQAFTRSKNNYAYLDQANQFIIVDAASSNKAEQLIEFLRQSLGSLPVVPLKTNTSPASLMTAWLKGENLSDDFVIKDECELQEEAEDGAIIRCKRQDLSSDEIQMHLDNGKQVTRLAVIWNDSIECLLQDDLNIKRVKFSDELLEQAAEDGAEDPAARFDADFNLMSGELSRFIPRLIEILDGENESPIK